MDELCVHCSGPATYEVQIQLVMLYDFPVCRTSYYTCKQCVTLPRSIHFEREHIADGPGTPAFGGCPDVDVDTLRSLDSDRLNPEGKRGTHG